MIKTKLKMALLSFLLINSFFQLIPFSKAMYSFDGYELQTRVYGKIHGGIFIGGGYGVAYTPYNIDFNIPNGTNVFYSALYAYIWGGTEYNEGSVSLKLNNNDFNTTELKGINDRNRHVLTSTHGAYSVCFNITNNIILNKQNNFSLITTGTSLDGRIYGVMLIVIYGHPDEVIKFCLADGNEGLHYQIKGKSHDNCSMTFLDTYNINNYENSTLWTSNVAGDSYSKDYLYFNDNLISDNVADESSGQNFDLDNFSITGLIQGSNKIEIKRGEESYLHPMNVVLIAKYKDGYDDGPDFIKFIEREFLNTSSVESDDFILQIMLVTMISSAFIIIMLFQFIRKKKLKKTSVNSVKKENSSMKNEKGLKSNESKIKRKPTSTRKENNK